MSPVLHEKSSILKKNVLLESYVKVKFQAAPAL